MKCKRCDIEYHGNLTRCHLCKTQLVGNKTNSVFPRIKQPKNQLLYKILLFVSFSLAVLFSFIEYIIFSFLSISKFVVLGLITNYILIKFIFNNYKNVFKMLNNYFRTPLILFFMWYLVTKSLVITTYLIPILCLIIFIFNSIIMLVLKDFYIIKFIKTIILDCLIGLIPLLLVALNLTTFNLLSYICAVLDLLVLAGLLIFCKDNILEELKKIFHF